MPSCSCSQCTRRLARRLPLDWLLKCLLPAPSNPAGLVLCAEAKGLHWLAAAKGLGYCSCCPWLPAAAAGLLPKGQWAAGLVLLLVLGLRSSAEALALWCSWGVREPDAGALAAAGESCPCCSSCKEGLLRLWERDLLGAAAPGDDDASGGLATGQPEPLLRLGRRPSLALAYSTASCAAASSPGSTRGRSLQRAPGVPLLGARSAWGASQLPGAGSSDAGTLAQLAACGSCTSSSSTCCLLCRLPERRKAAPTGDEGPKVAGGAA